MSMQEWTEEGYSNLELNLARDVKGNAGASAV